MWQGPVAQGPRRLKMRHLDATYHRRMRRALVITLVASVLSAVPWVMPTGASSARAAAPIPCVRTISGGGGAIPTAPDGDPASYSSTQYRLTAPTGPLIADVNVTYDITHPDRSDIRIYLDHTKSIGIQGRSGTAEADQPRPLTMDDEAAAAFSGSSGSGTWRPTNPLSGMDGVTSSGAWGLRVHNFQSGTGRVNSWSIRITYATCDSDGDTVEEKVDNCPSVPNAGQSDADGDGLGNECDADLDGDSIPNASDNCLIAPNLEQQDSDGDGVGDACDGDQDGDGVTNLDNCPTAPNADQANQDGDSLGNACDLDDDGDNVVDTSDKCRLVAGTAKGCPSVGRRVALKKARGGLVGRVKSKSSSCRSREKVRVLRVKPGKDKVVAKKRSTKRGRFKVKLGRQQGRFYAVLKKSYPGGQVQCGKARSKKVRR